MGRFAAGNGFADYEELRRWSVTTSRASGAVWDFFGSRAHAPPEHVLGARAMPGAVVPGRDAQLRRALLHGRPTRSRSSRARRPAAVELTFGELREQVARARAGLQRLGVGPGDRVVAYLPNIPETLIAFVATASLGAIWASVAPEFGARSVIDRFAQIEPKVLLAVDGYGTATSGSTAAPRWRRSGTRCRRSSTSLLELPSRAPASSSSTPSPFDHPLYVLFSSGTTGLPKAIVHGHGGILLEHLKNLGLSWDLKPGGALLWFTTTAG